MNLNESAIEDAALMWFGGLGYTVLRGLDIAPGELLAERTTFGETVLSRRCNSDTGGGNRCPGLAHGR